MNKADFKRETLALIGDDRADAVMLISVEDAVLWAQDELARRLGLTYMESAPVAISSSGISVLPDSCILPLRVWFVP